MARRPTATERLQSWLVEGRLSGHSPRETMRFLAEQADVADREAGVRALPADCLSPDLERPIVTRLRGRLGR